MYFSKKILIMKYLLIAALIYMVIKYNTLKSFLSSENTKKNPNISNNRPTNNEDQGEYIDYEEVE